MTFLEDTIVAIATAPGMGAVAVVRLAGPNAAGIATALAQGFNVGRPRVAQLLRLEGGAGQVVDQSLVTFFPAPHSFTGDDVVEFASHGGAMVPAQVVAACVELGARMAVAGEFTRRAVMNGKLDLIQAEAVGDLIAATAPAQARQALYQLDGGLSQRLATLREALLHAEALLAYTIDFPEEDDGPIDPAKITAALDLLETQLEHLLATAGEGERVRRGALVVLAGVPNAGKSSLFNALLGRDRAMVTEIAGTTRDAIEADLSVDGWPVRLVDTAGLHASEDRLELMGIEVSQRYLREADLVIFCRGPEQQGEHAIEFGEVPVVVVNTMADLLPSESSDHSSELRVSARTGEGLPSLRTTLVERLFATVRRSRGDEAMLTSVRQRVSVTAALAELREAQGELLAQEPVLTAHRLRSAVAALDELIGVVDQEEVFDRVFAGFCIGK